MGTINYQFLNTVWLSIVKRRDKAISHKSEVTSDYRKAETFESIPSHYQNSRPFENLSDLHTKIR